jgi:nucleoid DNA-binding protein/predicted GIY-YIG superfamily endonuclease
MIWHLYRIECTDGSLYTGITTDVARRFQEHVDGKGARYTRSHKPLRLVASCLVGSRAEALRAELALKRLPKARKIAAVQSFTGPHSTNHQRGNTMNKAELVEAVAKGAELSKADAEKALNAVIATVVKAVAKGDTVTLVGFGTFKSVKRAARAGRNPATGAALKIAASTSPKFTAGATFKTAVAGKKATKKT